MRLYGRVDRYCSDTGKKLKPQLQFLHIYLCDFCGREIVNDVGETCLPDVCYEIRESGDIEASFDQDSLKLTINNKPFNVELYDLHDCHSEFTYCLSWLGNTCEEEVLKIKTSYPPVSIAQRMYDGRYLAIKKAIERGVSVDELNLMERL